MGIQKVAHGCQIRNHWRRIVLASCVAANIDTDDLDRWQVICIHTKAPYVWEWCCCTVWRGRGPFYKDDKSISIWSVTIVNIVQKKECIGKQKHSLRFWEPAIFKNSNTILIEQIKRSIGISLKRAFHWLRLSSEKDNLSRTMQNQFLLWFPN